MSTELTPAELKQRLDQICKVGQLTAGAQQELPSLAPVLGHEQMVDRGLRPKQGGLELMGRPGDTEIEAIIA